MFLSVLFCSAAGLYSSHVTLDLKHTLILQDRISIQFSHKTPFDYVRPVSPYYQLTPSRLEYHVVIQI
jgi:hypothetical protein